jgi:hypothetical protein
MNRKTTRATMADRLGEGLGDLLDRVLHVVRAVVGEGHLDAGGSDGRTSSMRFFSRAATSSSLALGSGQTESQMAGRR